MPGGHHIPIHMDAYSVLWASPLNVTQDDTLKSRQTTRHKGEKEKEN